MMVFLSGKDLERREININGEKVDRATLAECLTKFLTAPKIQGDFEIYINPEKILIKTHRQ